MKNIEAYEIYKKITDGLAQCTVGFPVEILSARRKNIRALKPIVEDYEALKNDLIIKYGEATEDGKRTVALSNQEFMVQFMALNQIENDVALVTFNEDIIPNGLTPKEYDCLMCMITDESEAVECDTAK